MVEADPIAFYGNFAPSRQFGSAGVGIGFRKTYDELKPLRLVVSVAWLEVVKRASRSSLPIVAPAGWEHALVDSLPQEVPVTTDQFVEPEQPNPAGAEIFDGKPNGDAAVEAARFRWPWIALSGVLLLALGVAWTRSRRS